MENTIIVDIFKGATQETVFVCNIKNQYFSPEQTYNIHEHEYIKRYDSHLYRKIGEKNCRESLNETMVGYFVSLANILTQTYNLGKLDSVIFNSSGYGDCTGNTFILSTNEFSQKEEDKMIIDDKDLLFNMYKETFPDHELNL
ncbi:hypothetical protein [Yersinia phage fHe-Yen9-04]|uniref:Uncharacterized protein n=2 Tax=Eneladusvirus Yen904 TaxID=2560849 RepID=A0A2C9CXW9_9CAUD|nr:hypothetical protein FDJ41_gp493 [Yersinia phage fHe-Yen9-04]SOK58687.1 hypothetical protein [Yersinia phage fHe-Yen9-04]SOK59221.1 hypothetical protein [Yersinia phage fHe-Yen9-03]VUE36456.1 hypothetical protein [Yersinia phage fHe-Yen9-04]